MFYYLCFLINDFNNFFHCYNQKSDTRYLEYIYHLTLNALTH